MADQVNFTDVLTDVSETIKSDAGAEVLARVKDAFVERELVRRTDALVKAFDKLNTLRGDLKKIQPDNVLFDEDGNETSKHFTKAKLEERNKARKAVEKVEEAINQALAGDFNKVYSV